MIVIKASFAAQRPQGAHALAIAVRGEDLLADRLVALPEAARALVAGAAEAQGFEREPGAIAETFIDDDGAVRRVLLVGCGTSADDRAGERIGGALAARLLTSGETAVALDVAGLDAALAA